MRMYIGRTVPTPASELLPFGPNAGTNAANRVEANAARSIARHAIAMAVDGVPYVLWRYVPRAGHLCTCSLEEHAAPLPLAPPPPTSQADSTPPLPPEPSPAAPSAHGRSSFKQVRGGAPFYRTPLDQQITEATEQLEGKEYIPAYDDLAHLRPPEPAPTTPDTEGEFGELSHIFGGELQRCGICFGSRYEAAYQLQCGVRTLLTSRSHYSYSGAVVVDRTATPHTFEISSGGSVVWPVRGRLGVLAAWGLAALNNLEPAHNVRLEYSTDEQATWNVLHTHLLPSDGSSYHIRASQADLAVSATLTHVEFHLQTAALPVLQMPLYSDETNQDVFESLSTTNMELTAGVAPVGKQSYLLELKYRRMWKLNDVETKETAAGTVYSLECNSRAVQLSEQIMQLKRLYDNTYGQ